MVVQSRRIQIYRLTLVIGIFALLCYPYSGSKISRAPFSSSGCFSKILLVSNGSPDWVNMSPAVAPPTRLHSPLVYDSSSDRVILFSGALPFHPDVIYGFYNDTWTYNFNTNTWTNRSPVTMPPGRFGHQMAYDVESEHVILFSGGKSGYSITLLTHQETWAYHHPTNTWMNMSPSMMPSGRVEASMAYDSESDRIILFGGYTNGGIYNSETWAYDFNNNNWTQMNPSSHPSPRQSAPMAYDVESDRVILMGGWWEGIFYAETWAYDYNTDSWTQMNPVLHPLARSYGLAYDVESDRVISFGGAKDRAEQELTATTWAYDYNNNTWTNMNSATHPTPRNRAYFTYDLESDRSILFGGKGAGGYDIVFNDTWAYDYQSNPPSAPQNLQGTNSTGFVLLQWEAPVTNAGSPIIRYTIYRGITSDSLTSIDNYSMEGDGQSDGFSYYDIEGEPNVAYYYAVSASNIIGESPLSNLVVAEADPLHATTEPRIPGFPMVAIILGLSTALGLGLLSRRRRRF